MKYHARFEIDIVDALSNQLVTAFNSLDRGDFTEGNFRKIPRDQGVYQLYKQETLVYIGKSGDLPRRLSDHYRKISGRRNISVEEIGFKCLSVHPNWTALAPEESLIRYFKNRNSGDCEWNGNSFGPHDPGRNRETTNKPPQGFDAQYPIKEDWICSTITPGLWNGSVLLRQFKNTLPYLFRYQTIGSLKKGHPDYNDTSITIPSVDMKTIDILTEISRQLPSWQATAFPSHMILYKEAKSYDYGKVLE